MSKRKKKKRTHKYRKLKISLLLRTILITAITGAIGAFVMVYFVDGVFEDQFPQAFVSVMKIFGVSRSHSIELYWQIFGNNKGIYMLLFFAILFFVIFYGALSSLTSYLEDVEDSIENVISDSDEPIELIEELAPIEEKLINLKETLQRRERESQESEKKKSDLVLFLAHDLKTPLTSVIAYLSRLDSDQNMSEEERVKYTRIAKDKAIRLGQLIQEFFEITRFNMQDIQLDKQVINLSIMLEQLADELYAVLEQKKMTCQVHADEDIMIYGDPDKLARVFDNLLRNAISYSFYGTDIAIVAREVGDWTEIVFSNTGETIPEENLRTIFEKFYRMDSARSSETGGAGLGLAIAKEIVELHDGKISAISDDGETRFIVVLPKEDEAVRLKHKKELEKKIEAAIKEEKIHV